MITVLKLIFELFFFIITFNLSFSAIQNIAYEKGKQNKFSFSWLIVAKVSHIS